MTFAEFLVQKKAVTAEDLLRCVDYRRWLLPFIGTLAVNRGFLDAVQVLQILDECESKRRHFGDVAMELGLLDEEQVTNLLDLQSQAREELSSCLVRLGILTRVQVEDLEEEYREQFATEREPAPPRI